jgi:hypothetical protein
MFFPIQPVRILLAFVLLLLAAPVFAQWTDDGVLLSPNTLTVSDQAAIPVGDGGAAFVQQVHGTADEIEVIIVDRHGVIEFSRSAPLPAGLDQVSAVQAVADGVGGFWIAYMLLDGPNYSLWVNRFDAAGAPYFGEGLRCSGISLVFSPAAAADDDGSLLLAWNTAPMTGGEVRCQKVDFAGRILWDEDGVVATNRPNVTSDVQIDHDGQGGLIAIWQDNRYGNLDIFGQRVDSFGSLAWGSAGLEICTDAANQWDPILIRDAAGSCVVFWIDDRNSPSPAVYGQRVLLGGTVDWIADGTPVGSAYSPISQLTGVPDGVGGTMVFWKDIAGANHRIYGQGVQDDGLPVWALPLGKEVVLTTDSISSPLAVAFDGGAWVFFARYDGVDHDLYLQRVNTGGGASLGTGGMVLCGATGNQYSFNAGPDAAEGAYVVWRDERGGGHDAYAQRVTAMPSSFMYTYLGYPAARLDAVADVPGDQGGQVNLLYTASPLDQFPDNPITSYTLWRTLPGAKAVEDARVLDHPSQFLPDMVPPLFLRDSAGGKTTYWELMSVETPYGLPAYGRIVSTPYDSTGVYSEPITYKAMTHTDDPTVVWESALQQGLSVDNLAPAAPAGLAGDVSYDPTAVSLSWLPNGEADLAGYALYRGPGPEVPLDPAYLVAQPTGTEFVDTGWTAGDHYRLLAVDVHGNPSEPADLAPSQVSGLDDLAALRFRLHPCEPNPFNPLTTIRFDLPAPSDVDLVVYDAAGRRVRTLLAAEHHQRGTGTVVWDGRDDGGRLAPAGVYVYRLQAGGNVQTRKMVIVK